MKKIPSLGMEREEVLTRLREFGKEDANYRDCRTWSLVYYLNDEHTAFLKEAYGLYFSENALNPMAFKSLKRMETDIVQMTGQLLNGDDQVVGTMTSGGTETCLLPVVTYRDRAKALRGLTSNPEMIAPQSIHVAWEKAAHYFGIKMVHAPLNDRYLVDTEAMERLINKNTMLLVASAPCYPFGTIDSIEALGDMASRHGLPLHVDSCLGGFLLPFVERIEDRQILFDFRVPGVTSIGADLHKYGFAAKGASVLLYRSMEYLKHQFFVYADSPTGIFASAGLLGTRPGGAISAAWAALHTVGFDGYLKIARSIMETTTRLKEGIEAIPGLKVLGEPAMSVFAYASEKEDVDIYAVGDQMEKRGWLMDRVQHPSGLHCMVTPRHAEVVDAYLSDLREAVEIVRDDPTLAMRGNAAMYGMVAHAPLRGRVKAQVTQMMAAMYGPEGKMPGLENGEGQGDSQGSRIQRALFPTLLKCFKWWNSLWKKRM